MIYGRDYLYKKENSAAVKDMPLEGHKSLDKKQTEKNQLNLVLGKKFLTEVLQLLDVLVFLLIRRSCRFKSKASR